MGCPHQQGIDSFASPRRSLLRVRADLQRKTSKALAADADLRLLPPRLENRDHGKASILLLEIGKRWQAG